MTTTWRFVKSIHKRNKADAVAVGTKSVAIHESYLDRKEHLPCREGSPWKKRKTSGDDLRPI